MSLKADEKSRASKNPERLPSVLHYNTLLTARQQTVTCDGVGRYGGRPRGAFDLTVRGASTYNAYVNGIWRYQP